MSRTSFIQCRLNSKYLLCATQTRGSSFGISFVVGGKSIQDTPEKLHYCSRDIEIMLGMFRWVFWIEEDF